MFIKPAATKPPRMPLALDARIEDEDLDGRAEAAEVRETLERVQFISLELSEQLDAYQQRYAS
jgi:hypothetical protein